MRSPRTTTKSSPCLLQLETVRAQQQRPNAAKNKKLNLKKNWKKKKKWGSIPHNRSTENDYKKMKSGASLVAQWLRVCLPMQGTWVRALVWEDPTCRGAARPVSHDCWACASGACARQREAAMVRGPRTAVRSGHRLPQLGKALAQKRGPNTAIHTYIHTYIHT